MKLGLAGAKEVSEWRQKNLLDRGHDIEAAARDEMSKYLGEELFPAVGETDDVYLTASFDGLSLDWSVSWECKSWNEKKAYMVRDGKVPPEDYWQVVHQAVVTGSEHAWYEVTDGNGRSERLKVRISEKDKATLIAAWKQFDADLENYRHAEVIPAAVASPQMALPAVFVQVGGAIEIRDNLAAFGDALRAYIHGINRKPETDQDFADLDAAAKLLREAQERIRAAKDSALGQIASIDDMRRAADMIEDLARTTAIELEKLVDAEKKNRRAAIIAKAQAEIDAHVAILNERIGKPWMPRPLPDFQGAAKGKKTLQSVQDAVSQALANSKIAANEAADKIEINLRRLRELAAGYETLFADAQQLVMKDAEAMEAIVRQRIAEQKALEDKRRAEAAEAERRAEAGRAQNTAQPSPSVAQVPSLPAPAAVAVPDDGKRMTLGEINGALGVIAVTRAGLETLGFPPVETKKAAMLYRESDFPAMCNAIIAHLQRVARRPIRQS